MKADVDRLDRLTRARLAQLAETPVDTSRLEQRLQAALWQQAQRRRAVKGRPRWLVKVAAAVLLVAGASLLIVQGGSSPVVAAPIAVARLHRDLVGGQVPVEPVGNIEAARYYLQTYWSDAPALPNPEAATVTGCCRQNLQNRQVACVLLTYRNQHVTMMVGKSRELVCGAKHEDVTHHGRSYAVHEADGLQMVMIERQGRWICLMGSAPVETLMDLADSLRD